MRRFVGAANGHSLCVNILPSNLGISRHSVGLLLLYCCSPPMLAGRLVPERLPFTAARRKPHDAEPLPLKRQRPVALSPAIELERPVAHVMYLPTQQGTATDTLDISLQCSATVLYLLQRI